MHRKDFLKACTGALCGCAAASVPPAEAEPPTPDDWRLPWVKERYAKLLEELSRRMDDSALAAALEQVGNFCAVRRDAMTKRFAGDPDGFCREISKGHHEARYDPARKTATVIFTPDGECYCPLNGVAYKTPGAVCNCSIGYQKRMWRIVLQAEPKVALKESILRGGKTCTFKITSA